MERMSTAEVALDFFTYKTPLLPTMETFRPKKFFSLSFGRYLLKTAASPDELREACRLRHQVFLAGKGPTLGTELDFDEFDLHCDHLLILDRDTLRLCGTYRLLSSDHTGRFYSETEFFLDNFLGLPDRKLELGRACIHPEHRNGAVIDLLWRGLAKYAMESEVRYLFGCSSLNTLEAELIARTLQELQALQDLQELSIDNPYGIFPYKGIFVRPGPIAIEEKTSLIPPLLRTYLSAGARVFGPPALDVNFECIDFFTVLDLHHLHPAYRRRYFK